MESASLNELKSFENCFVFIRVFYSFLVIFQNLRFLETSLSMREEVEIR